MGLVESSILQEADAIINGPRQDAYGHPGLNFQRIALKWSVTLGIPVTREQVAICMIDLKTSRLINEPTHRDSWLDIAGYAGCADRFREKPIPEDPEALYAWLGGFEIDLDELGEEVVVPTAKAKREELERRIREHSLKQLEGIHDKRLLDAMPMMEDYQKRGAIAEVRE